MTFFYPLRFSHSSQVQEDSLKCSTTDQESLYSCSHSSNLSLPTYLTFNQSRLIPHCLATLLCPLATGPRLSQAAVVKLYFQPRRPQPYNTANVGLNNILTRLKKRSFPFTSILSANFFTNSTLHKPSYLNYFSTVRNQNFQQLFELISFSL